MSRFRVPLLASLLALAACTVGPDHAAPVTPSAAAGAFIGADRPVFTAQEIREDWWRLYQDPVLDSLIEDAFRANTDLRVATANLRRARALLRESRAGRLPQTGIGAGATYGRLPENQVPANIDREDWSFDAGLDISYEVDLFGRVSRTIEAARADAEAVDALRRAVQVAVVADTVRAYTDAAAAGERLEVAERSLALIDQTLRVTTRRFEAGLGTRLDVVRVTSLRDQQRAELPPLRAERDGALFRLATLTGRAPAELPPSAGARRTIVQLDQAIPVGDGATLLARRPDVREAERRLAAETARVGVATADLYPRITLGGSVGATGPSLGDLFTGGPFRFLLGPLISWSFPNQEAIRARIRAAEASAEGALANFDGTVLRALQETETALSAYRHELDRRVALADARNAAQRAAEIERARLRAGRANSLEVLDAERTLAEAEAVLVQSEARITSAQIDLFRALGGGWQREVVTAEANVRSPAQN
ncbi:efflux transporter outer membrane subunit [Sphingosinicella sp. LHD-64]|uniref:efflux transporter outer membrane subunit n=1 Tax=Sphingosinicella sp. LHD-64 TaxID=3072139 RepID=UPI00280F24E8|nr:efflux transporter outer membrane subunit [Sphingosinicella sp. LHD-64]MDQ8755757.1 efflux transporter outer membrane subunit [Sphingosinicella sp. LHD-64]